jgi:hypothetical protein
VRQGPSHLQSFSVARASCPCVPRASRPRSSSVSSPLLLIPLQDGTEEEKEETAEGETRTGPYGSPSTRKGGTPSPRRYDNPGSAAATGARSTPSEAGACYTAKSAPRFILTLSRQAGVSKVPKKTARTLQEPDGAVFLRSRRIPETFSAPLGNPSSYRELCAPAGDDWRRAGQSRGATRRWGATPRNRKSCLGVRRPLATARPGGNLPVRAALDGGQPTHEGLEGNTRSPTGRR